MEWRVAHKGKGEVYKGVCRGIQRERYHLVKPDVDGKIKLRWIFRKWDGGPWTGLIWLRIGQLMSICKYSNKPSSCMKCGEFLD
jgi:hypothetical protein